jgi:hypothetical protein
MLFKEIIAVYTENHAKPKTKTSQLLAVEPGGTYIYNSALKG